MITDANGNPIETNEKAKADEEAIKESMDGGKALEVKRLREGQLMLAFLDTASKRLGAIGYMRRLEADKVQQKMVTDPPELQAMYREVARLESEVIGLVAEVNYRAQERDERRASTLGLELYSDAEFFGRPLEQSSEKGEA